MSLMEQRQTVKVQSAVRGRECTTQPEVCQETRAKKSAEFKKLKLTTTTTAEMKKPTCWDSFANIFKADATKIA